MLIAEIHGKRFPEAEGQEDWLTSAVFGHLRQIPPGAFWTDLFERAHTIAPRHSLYSRIREAGIRFDQYSRLDIHFWKSWEKYGEPDLVLCFAGGEQPPLLIVLEVKLDSGKSGNGENDQLKRYLQLIDDPDALRDLLPEFGYCYLVYLTRAFSELEIEDSIRVSADAGIESARDRIFGLQWQDVLESAALNAAYDPLLKEVAEFLKIRGFEAFRGFRISSSRLGPMSGRFYGRMYFIGHGLDFCLNHASGGRFYGN